MKTNIAKQRIVPVTPVNVPQRINVIVNKSFVRNFVMSPFLWGIGIIILMILAWWSMEDLHHSYDEDFFKEYGWVSCYECDTIFYVIDELVEHQRECDKLKEQ